MLIAVRSQHLSWFGLQCQKLGNLLCILWNKVLKSTQMCTSVTFWPCLAWYERALQKWRFHLPTRRCSLSQLQQNPILVQRQFPAVLEKGIVASFIAWSQPNGLQYLVHVGNWGLSSPHTTVQSLVIIPPKLRAAVESFRGRIE